MLPGGWRRSIRHRRREVKTVKKILIVDDHSHVRELVEATLDIGDYAILQAASGDEALTIARAEYPDLILLDVMMPNSLLDGFEVCRQLKSDPATRSISIVMLTARGQEADVEAGKQAGADDYFTKPFSPLQLVNKVEELLG
jgi:DNA-binding response OmpR family regulator